MFNYDSKVPAVPIAVFITILEQNRYKSCQSSTKFSEEGGTSIVNHLHQQPRVTWSILATKVNGVYISQLIPYARASSNYCNILKRHLYLRNRLLDQGYKKIRLIRSLNVFYNILMTTFSMTFLWLRIL
jgi:hypothetical protein